MKSSKLLILSAILMGLVALVLFTTCGKDKTTEPPPCYTITADTTGMGTVDFSPDSSCYHSGTAVTLTAVARSGWAFDSWSGDTSTTVNPLVLTITGNISVTATFVQVFTLTVHIVPSQSGTVLVDPDLNYFHPGDAVTLTAQAGAAYGFSHWVYGTEIRGANPTTIVFRPQNEEITSRFGTREGEPDCADGYVDSYNGGCNFSPNRFQPIADGQIYIARSGLFSFDVYLARDLDWFRYVASDNRNITFTGVAQFPLELWIIDGSAGCDNATILADSTASPSDTLTVTASVGSGVYWLVAGPSIFQGPYPCPQDYKVWFSAEQTVGAVSFTKGRQPLENELSRTK